MSNTVIVTTEDDLVRVLKGHFPSALPAMLPDEAAELELLKRKQMLTAEEVQKLYGLNARTLANKRQAGTGPAYIQEQDRGQVYYEHEAIMAYINSCRKQTYE